MIQGVAAFSTTEDISALSDAEVLARSHKEPELFSVLVRRYEAPFLRRARTILFDGEEAREAVQDAFTKLYLYADRYEPQEGASFSAWAYTVLNRVAYTRYQAARRRNALRAPLEPEHYESLPDEQANFLEELSVRNEVLWGLAKLPEAAARILRLQFLEDKTQEEIAANEGLSVSAVKTRIHRAKKLFKKNYDKHHE